MHTLETPTCALEHHEREKMEKMSRGILILSRISADTKHSVYKN